MAAQVRPPRQGHIGSNISHSIANQAGGKPYSLVEAMVRSPHRRVKAGFPWSDGRRRRFLSARRARVRSGRVRARVEAALVAALLGCAGGWALGARADVAGGTAGLPPPSRLSLAKVTTLDDPTFARDRVRGGLFFPDAASDAVGFGIFFLQPYDPARIPVLFVHGMAGSPLDFRKAVAALDLACEQPWVFSYPTGLRLPVVARVLASQLGALHDRLRPARVLVVAHSMGGLVARAAILDLAAAGRADFVAGLVTISTPYGGQVAAGLGARQVPGLVPAWTDLAPGSAFLTSLRTPLPARLAFDLLFSYGSHGYGSRGADRHFWDMARWFSLATVEDSNDGVVTLDSELQPWAQDQAAHLYGYDADHTSILVLPEALARLARLLADACPRVPGAR